MVGYVNDQYVELDRTFHELSSSAKSDEDELQSLFGLGKPLTWHDLTKYYRVLLLSEAGSGKTKEIRNLSQRLKADGKPAFFVRLEYVVDGLESAFEVENDHEEFVAWLGGMDGGWVLLDSVDEARLRDPSDFEKAIRTLARALGPAKQRAHLVITGRTSAWRPKTDLSLCETYLPHAALEGNNSGDDYEDAGGLPPIHELSPDERSRKKGTMYKVVTFDHLSARQIEVFAGAKGSGIPRRFWMRWNAPMPGLSLRVQRTWRT